MRPTNGRVGHTRSTSGCGSFSPRQQARAGISFFDDGTSKVCQGFMYIEATTKLLSNAWNVQTRDYAPKLEAGARLGFDLRANPVVAHSGEGKHARHDVVMQEKKRFFKNAVSHVGKNGRMMTGQRSTRSSIGPAARGCAHVHRDSVSNWMRRVLPWMVISSIKKGMAGCALSSVDLSGKLTVVAQLHLALRCVTASAQPKPSAAGYCSCGGSGSVILGM